MTSPSQLAEGSIIADKYRVERVLGSGGMGIVVAARHIVLGERVALKFLRPEALGNAEAIGRFIREARAATRIKSDHVARVTDVVQLEDGALFMVMEYLEGVDLAALVGSQGALPVETAVDYVLQASEAIAEAHARGIVHRDLKPENLFCTHRADGTPLIKVFDFGISKLVEPGQKEQMLTKATAVIGSPMYMSPEQMRRSRDADVRTDIWSLGVILFELLTADTPFRATSLPELTLKVMGEPPETLRSRLPSAPIGLELVISRCLEKNRELRFQTVGEFAVALEEFATPAGSESVKVIVGTLLRRLDTGRDLVPPPAGSSDSRLGVTFQRSGRQSDGSWGGGTEPKRSRRMMALGAFALVCVTLVGAGVVVMRAPAPSVSTSGSPVAPPDAAATSTAAPEVLSATPQEPPTGTPPLQSASQHALQPPRAAPTPSAKGARKKPMSEEDRLGL